MKAVFRTDASLDIGTGHVMRCLTLAEVLKGQGAECHFICREHTGHLMNRIRAAGHEVHPLPVSNFFGGAGVSTPAPTSPYIQWLGASPEQEALECASILESLLPDWLIVDHYALDAHWESLQRPYCSRILVIDDLTNRNHDCDMLLDQTFGRQQADYLSLVSKDCTLLCGSQYALLRPEFSQWRPYSLARRKVSQLKHLVITMGGVDQDNATGWVLDTLAPGALAADTHVSIVLGEGSPWLSDVQRRAQQLPWSTNVLIGVANMAQLMAKSDLAIGAAGATSWERCCLGLPTLLMIIADNQRAVAQGLEQAGAVRIISRDPRTDFTSINWNLCDLQASPDKMTVMTNVSASAVDGGGIKRLMCALYEG